MSRAKTPKKKVKPIILKGGTLTSFFDDGTVEQTLVDLGSPPVIVNNPAGMWRAFLREYAKPLAKAPGWFAADGFRIELADGRELPVTPHEVNPTADTLLVLRTRSPANKNGREEVSTSAVPWAQVARISVVTHSG
jgi:hypothetical protein